MSQFLGKNATFTRREPVQEGGTGFEGFITCGLQSYRYDADLKQVSASAESSLLGKDIALELRRPMPSLELALSALVGSVATFNAQAVSKSIVRSWKHGDFRPAILAGTISGVLTGLVVGFWWTYEPVPRCGDPVLVAYLRDHSIWSMSSIYRWN